MDLGRNETSQLLKCLVTSIRDDILYTEGSRIDHFPMVFSSIG